MCTMYTVLGLVLYHVHSAGFSMCTMYTVFVVLCAPCTHCWIKNWTLGAATHGPWPAGGIQALNKIP